MAKRKETSDQQMNIEIPSFKINMKHISVFLCLVGLMLIALIGYVFRTIIFDTTTLMTERLLSWTGIGVAIIGIWITAISIFGIRKSIISTLRNFPVYVLALILTSLSIWTFMSLYTPEYGFPGWTSESAGVSLGGKFVQSITGNSTIVALVCSTLLIIAAIVSIKPRIGSKAFSYSKSGAVFGYLLCYYVSKSIAGMYRGPKRHPKLVSAKPDSSNIPPEIMTPHLRESTIIGDLEQMEVETTFESPTPTKDTGKDWIENAGKFGYFLPNESISEDANKKDELEKEDSPEIFASKDRIEIEKDGAKFNSHWSVEYTDSKPTKEDDSSIPEIKDSKRIDKSSKWILPNKAILSDEETIGISREQIKETSEMIKNTFAEYKVEVEVEKVRPGPTVTMYGIEPGWIRKLKRVRVKDENGQPKLDKNKKPIVTQVEEKTRISVDTILRREKDLSLALKTPSLRIETPVMGESLLGIEVPNPDPSIVSLKRVMNSSAFKSLSKKSALPVALGRGSDGQEVVFDLTKMPHLLVAGATGSGKSVCLNALISCLIMERSPNELQMLLIDPKRVELTLYNGIPHLVTPVVVETDKVVSLLKGLIKEMMDRYRTMEEMGVRNIHSYNSKVKEKMPYIVVAIDELADLMMTAAFDVEQSICRLAQLGRATGIHLIIATQRPSVDVITGLIKANFPSRISFAVTSQIDSRTIMDTVGAEKLLGRGDMLYQPIDGTRPTRVQNVFISDNEINALVEHWKESPWSQKLEIDLHTVGDSEEGSDGVTTPNGGGQDELITRALQLASKHNKLSTSLLQRRLRIGYPRAARLMDELEDMGIVSSGDGSKSRDVIANSNV